MDWLDPALISPRADLEWLATRLADGLRAGRHLSSRRGRGVEFAQHRSYDRGDDVRLIDWKAYGRTERLVIREAEVATDHRYWLVLDASPSMAMRSPAAGHEKFDVARALAAGLAAVAERQGDDYGLALLGEPRPPTLPAGRGGAWMSRLLARLHSLTTAASTAGRVDDPETAAHRLATALQARDRASEAVILTDGYEHAGELVACVRELGAHGVPARVLLLETAFERDWPVDRDMAFEDLESGQLVLSGPGGRKAFLAARSASLAALRDALLDHDCPLAAFSIDAPWDRQLRDWLDGRLDAPA